jgi:hypothetical protein
MAKAVERNGSGHLTLEFAIDPHDGEELACRIFDAMSPLAKQTIADQIARRDLDRIVESGVIAEELRKRFEEALTDLDWGVLMGDPRSLVRKVVASDEFAKFVQSSIYSRMTAAIEDLHDVGRLAENTLNAYLAKHDGLQEEVRQVLDNRVAKVISVLDRDIQDPESKNYQRWAKAVDQAFQARIDAALDQKMPKIQSLVNSVVDAQDAQPEEEDDDDA